MDNSLLLPIIIIFLIVVLFILVSLNSRKIDVMKKKKIVENLLMLNQGSKDEDIAVRRDTIIKLDNLLSKSLQLYFNNNALCGDNLKSANKIFKRRAYDSLWEVHKLRNKIVHDDYAPSIEQSKHAFEVYKMSIIKILQ
jgi:hypothetical protein